MKTRQLGRDGHSSGVSGLWLVVAAGLVGAATTVVGAVVCCRERRKRELAALTSRLQQQVQEVHETL